MNNKNLLTFYKKTVIFLIPIFLLIGWYIKSDPFRVLNKYQTYENNPILLNTGYIAWQTFLNHKDSLKYDSYIMGNSCAMAFPTTLWQPFIENGSPIRLNANSESLYAIYKKIKRLDQLNMPIENVLLLLDNEILQKISKSNSHNKILHSDVSAIGKVEFQKKFATAFFNPKFLIPYVDFKLFHTYRNYMEGIIMNKYDQRNQLTNDIINPREAEIEKLKDQYWVKHKKELPFRADKVNPHVQAIFNKQKYMLKEICSIFQKHNTNYQIIINPEWSQKKFNTEDLKLLKTIFEKNRVHDFSGKNQYTENKTYFYEQSHYRPLLGKIILQKIYRQ